MAVSEAKRAANRRNAQKSTGPRIEAGKARANFNAVTRGMRAETLVLPGEDPQALEARRAAWYASLGPVDEVEASAVDDAVASNWMQDRARRAQATRIAANIANAGVDEADLVLRLCHRRGTAIVDALTIDPRAFDDSREGERLRHNELASGRGVSRALDRRIKLRRPEPAARNDCDECAAPEVLNATNEASTIDEIATNEATARLENMTNEANARLENMTNEANARLENVTNEANVRLENVTNEANARLENMTNEANARLENVTNEANMMDLIVTNEAKLAARSHFSTGGPGLDFDSRTAVNAPWPGLPTFPPGRP